MPQDVSMITNLVPVIVSAVLGLIGIWLALRKRSDEDSLARATRRTTALQLLSDEEFSLMLVFDECVALRSMIASGRTKLAGNFDYLAEQAKRIVGEAHELLSEVQAKRERVEPLIQTMTAVEIETIIAAAYHGKKLAEAQLLRTRLSRADTIQIYGVQSFTRSTP